jgi:hypothetical protein
VSSPLSIHRLHDGRGKRRRAAQVTVGSRTDVVISYDADPVSTTNTPDTLTLRGVTLAQLHADDFLFV